MKNYPELLSIASKFRGEIINETIWIEKCIDIYLATYFCNNEFKKLEMHLLIFGDNRMSFENKKQAFDYLAKKTDLEWYKSYISTRDDSRKKGRIPLASDLDYIILNRNILAHCMLDLSKSNRETNDDIFTLIRFKNDKQHHMFTPELLKQLHNILRDITEFFVKKLE